MILSSKWLCIPVVLNNVGLWSDDEFSKMKFSHLLDGRAHRFDEDKWHFEHSVSSREQACGIIGATETVSNRFQVAFHRGISHLKWVLSWTKENRSAINCTRTATAWDSSQWNLSAIIHHVIVKCYGMCMCWKWVKELPGRHTQKNIWLLFAEHVTTNRNENCDRIKAKMMQTWNLLVFKSWRTNRKMLWWADQHWDIIIIVHPFHTLWTDAYELICKNMFVI